MTRHPLRDAMPFPLTDAVVEKCLRPDHELDAVFATAYRGSLASVPGERRSGALNGIVGHVAECVIESVLHELGYYPIWDLEGPGRHGIDLAMLSPATDRVIVFEVKGTLRRRRLPSLTRGELEQLSAAWIDKADNPGMADLELESGDVYGGVAVAQFADRSFRIGLSSDFQSLRPVDSIEQLIDLTWLDRL